jgi:DNA mismatch repair protein MutL
MPERIALLAREVVERIAAGEVIERPASVVRELLDNALDAGATSIRVEVRDGGLTLMRVADDGEGIVAEDLQLALTSHATSKVRRLDDLEHVSTLGFRGEALASIAAVAEIEIASAADDAGIARALRSGPEMAAEFSDSPRPKGTTVTVREIFAMVPARRSLLRSARVETGHILAVARAQALAHPAVRLLLIADGCVLAQTSGSGQHEAVAEIYGSDVARALLPFGPIAVGGSVMSGVIAGRAFHAATREHVLLTINGRPVNNRTLLAALESGYRPLLRKGRHPLIIAEITTPPHQVDANIHPSKAEVLLRDEQAIGTALRAAVSATLGHAPLSALDSAHARSASPLARPMPLRFPRRRSRQTTRIAERPRHYDTDEVDSPLDPGPWEPLAQFDDTLILARTASGHLLLVDQHRAHERILYERLMQHRESMRRLSGAATTHVEPGQLLLEPLLVELSPLQARQLEPRLDDLRALGLDFQPFGGSVFLVRSVPNLPGMAHDATTYAATLAEEAAADSNEWLDIVCMSLACRAAIRRGQPLALEEQRALLNELHSVANVASCPHGSPLLLRYSRSGLARAFEW